MGVGENLNKIMGLQGYNPTTLAKKSGVPQPRIYEIVSGTTQNPQLKTLQKLAQALEVSVDELTSEIRQKTSAKECFESYGVHKGEKELLGLFRKMPEAKKDALITIARALEGI